MCYFLATQLRTKNKKHFTKGKAQIIHLKSALNKGLSESLKLAFPTVHLLGRPVYTGPSGPLNPY